MKKDFLQILREKNSQRNKEDLTGIGKEWSLEKIFLKLAEESGELIQCYNKNKSKEEILEEAADVVIVVDLILMKYNASLEEAIKDKFNKTSKKKNSKIIIE